MRAMHSLQAASVTGWIAETFPLQPQPSVGTGHEEALR